MRITARVPCPDISRSPGPAGYVPVHTGTPRFRTADHGGFQLTDAWFPPKLEIAPHEHERTVVAVTLQGEWDSVMLRRPYACAAASVLIEPAGERHANHFATGTHVLILQPEASRCDGLGAAGRLLHRAARFRSDAIAVTRAAHAMGAAEKRTPRPPSASRDSVSRSSRPRAGWGSRGVAGIRRRAGCLARSSIFTPTAWTGSRSPTVAAALDVRPAQLARAFRRHQRVSIGSYVRELRVQWAIDRLTGSTQAISDIAISAGFADQSHFTRALRAAHRADAGAVPSRRLVFRWAERRPRLARTASA